MIKISDAEYEVMEIIWKNEKITSGEIIKKLENKKWSYNTIRTLIKRLYEKGAIKIVETIGKTYTYSPVIDEKEYKIEITKDLLKKLYNNSIQEFLEAYYQSAGAQKEDFEELIKILKRRKK